MAAELAYGPPGLLVKSRRSPGATHWRRRVTRPLHRVFCGFDRPCPHDLPGRLGLECHGLFGERVGAPALFRSGLFDNDKFREAWNEEDAGATGFSPAFLVASDPIDDIFDYAR